MTVTYKQLRAARGLTMWTQIDLAERTGLSLHTIKNLENNKGKTKQDTINKIITAYQLAGIEFVKGGVVEASTLIFMNGHQGFSDFLDDVYTTAKTYGTFENPTQVFLSNVVHENWIKWMGPEKWKNHTERMTRDKSLMDVRIIVKENDWNFPAAAYSQYKWVKEDQFNDRSFYSYHDKLAFLNFREDDVEITIMRQPEFAEGYRTLFLNTWHYVAQIPPTRRE